MSPRLGEDDLIARYFAPLAGPGGLVLRDDAALMHPPPGEDLVLTADALVANLRPHATERMGIGTAVNPRLIESHLTGYGWTGPYAKRPGIDPLEVMYLCVMLGFRGDFRVAYGGKRAAEAARRDVRRARRPV